ncbi:hypothetical protein [Xenorhabdus innexi]|uniref:Uncharacterized protein n=1 Tax=Xenorhabdus innexi TaxID=290109 RepID=A0A1N6N1W6_9GAMM|nr:hypothetical protein [Xenorhabdus innexi]PHM37180.1 hypothetical protein Xinn_01147 [Xenorhabdus innexi]SIP75039.1 conserved hypothetical protein [Xenorhabdus innexi]
MEEALKKFNSWLKIDTWHTGHPLDEARFLKSAYGALIAKRDLDSETLRDYIVNFVNETSKLNERFLEERAEEYASKFDVISEFVRVNSL